MLLKYHYYYAQIIFRAVPLCPKHVSTQLQYFIALMNVLLESFTYVMTSLLEYINLFLCVTLRNIKLRFFYLKPTMKNDACWLDYKYKLKINKSKES